MSFKKLTSETLKIIRPLLESKLPKTTMVLNMVDMALTGKYPECDRIEFFSFNGVPKDPDQLFLDIFIQPKHHVLPCAVIEADEPSEEMLDAFTRHHNWKVPHSMESVNTPIARHLVKCVLESGGIVTFYPNAMLYLPKEDALQLDVANHPVTQEFELDRLMPEEEIAKKVNYHWKYGFDGGDQFLMENLKSMGGIGAFRKVGGESKNIRPRSADNLVGWVTLQHLGSLGALHTVDECRGKGIAKFLMEAGSKWVAEQGLIPFVEVEAYNIASMKVMEKIGYKMIHDVYWVDYMPESRDPTQ